MTAEATLRLPFHGRIIDALGTQMYNCPAAVIAEVIANAWDADATDVNVQLPDTLGDDAEIVVTDNGVGMTLDECQSLYLSIGRNRRKDVGTRRRLSNRPVLGRKGIGKFSGFGIANILHVRTTSKATGEHTAFTLDLDRIRSSGEFVAPGELDVPVVARRPPDRIRRYRSGTEVRLQSLRLQRRLDPKQFARLLSHRFLVAQQADQFRITVNGRPLPDDLQGYACEYDFPRDLNDSERPSGVNIDGEEGREFLPSGEEIRWRFRFTKMPITGRELRGIAVFCGIKLAQKPFFFHLSGRHNGQKYLTGIVRADYLDQLDEDLISAGRERLNWNDERAAPLRIWGQERVMHLLRVWKDRRAKERARLLDECIDTPTSQRPRRFPTHERRIVRSALKELGAVDSLDERQFANLGNAILTAWQRGRLEELIKDLGQVHAMDLAELIGLLMEAEMLTALHTSEAVRAKLSLIGSLRKRMATHGLEDKVRDYILDNPWLLAPKWETFRKEHRLAPFLARKEVQAYGAATAGERQSADRVFSSGQQLLLIGSMKPGVAANRYHVNWLQRQCDNVAGEIQVNAKLPFKDLEGLLVTDKLAKPLGMTPLLARIAVDNMHCVEWHTLLATAESQWREFLDTLKGRNPRDERLRNL